MNKYGVDQDIMQEEDEKFASEVSATIKNLCPECGAICEKHGKVLLCPTHGSAPFEKEKK
jgi:hypothetical protein